MPVYAIYKYLNITADLLVKISYIISTTSDFHIFIKVFENAIFNRFLSSCHNDIKKISRLIYRIYVFFREYVIQRIKFTES